MTTRPTITVALDPVVQSRAVIRWAVREAARRRADLRIATTGDHDGGTAAKLTASADAELLVVAGPASDADELVMRAYCPVVIVPDRYPLAADRGGPVTRDPSSSRRPRRTSPR